MTDAAKIAAGLRPHEKSAVHFLYGEVEHEIGPIDDDEKLGVALCFRELARRGIVRYYVANAPSAGAGDD